MPSPQFTQSDVSSALNSRYQISKVLRIGGQGVVYRATRVKIRDGSPALDDVALKIHLDPTQDERVEREIRAMEGMRHPNFANLVEHGSLKFGTDTYKYAAWEFIDGSALDERLVAGPLAPKTVCIIGRDVATAIDFLWSRKRIVHRDVNPKNIMLRTGDRDAVLIDLGIAKHQGQAPLTAPTFTWGTEGYYSPEQARAERNLTCAADVFSLGITLQEVLLGRHPTNRDQRALMNGGPKLASIAPSAPAALAAIIDQMVLPRPAFRPQPGNLASALSDLTFKL